MLDATAEKAIARLTEAIRAVFGLDLVSLILYGSGAGEDFVTGRSDLNLAIVLEHVRFAHLRALHDHLPAWHKLGMAPPLLLDRRFLARGRDVFPMELLDIKAQHRVLYGEEVITQLHIDARHLRYQSEHEARSKLLRLRALYAEVGAEQERLQALMLDSVKTFVIIMRNLLRLNSAHAPVAYLDVLKEFESRFGVRFASMEELIRVRAQTAKWPQGVESAFAAYLDEVEKLVELIDHFHGPADTHGAAPEHRDPSHE